MSPRPGGDVSNSSEFAVMGSGEHRAPVTPPVSARTVALQFIRQRPGLALIIAYAVVTIVARFDDVWFYRLFGINIFNYAEISDVLFAPLRNSIVLLFFLVPALVLFLASWAMRKRPVPDIAPDGKARAQWNTPVFRLLAASVVVVIVAAGLARFHAGQRWEARKAGKGRIVELTRTDGITYDENPVLLGSAGKFFIFYFPKRKETEILPSEKASLITVDLPPGPDPAQELRSTGVSTRAPRL